MLRCTLVLLCVLRCAYGQRLYEIHPVGGPVLGDTAITVIGTGLSGVECQFEKRWPPDFEDPPPPQRTTCKFNVEDGGTVCVCAAPKAPRRQEVTEAVDQFGVTTTVITPIGDYIGGEVVVTAQNEEGEEWSPFDVTFHYYSYNREVWVDAIEPSAGEPTYLLTYLLTYIEPSAGEPTLSQPSQPAHTHTRAEVATESDGAHRTASHGLSHAPSPQPQATPSSRHSSPSTDRASRTTRPATAACGAPSRAPTGTPSCRRTTRASSSRTSPRPPRCSTRARCSAPCRPCSTTRTPSSSRRVVSCCGLYLWCSVLCRGATSPTPQP